MTNNDKGPEMALFSFLAQVSRTRDNAPFAENVLPLASPPQKGQRQRNRITNRIRIAEASAGVF